MTKAQKSKLLPQARKLYAEGNSIPRICELLGIGSRNTLVRWRAEDEKATGKNWDSLRTSQLSSDPFAPARAGRRRVVWLLMNQDKFLDDPGFDDRLTKAIQNLDNLDKRFASVDRVQDVLEQLGLWARANVPEDGVRCPHCRQAIDGLAVLRDISDRFMASLRAGHEAMTEDWSATIRELSLKAGLGGEGQ